MNAAYALDIAYGSGALLGLALVGVLAAAAIRQARRGTPAVAVAALAAAGCTAYSADTS